MLLRASAAIRRLLPPLLACPCDLSWPAATGVLTKLDIMDPGTNAREVLEGQAVKLKHGWIGVVNRGQADINSRARQPPCPVGSSLLQLLCQAAVHAPTAAALADLPAACLASSRAVQGASCNHLPVRAASAGGSCAGANERGKGQGALPSSARTLRTEASRMWAPAS